MQYAINNGIINLDDVRNRMKEAEKQRLLALHNYKIFQAKDGRWKTTVLDETKKSGRRYIAKTSLNKLEDALVAIYKEKEDKDKLDQEKVGGKNREEITLRDIFPLWLDFKNSHTNSSSYTKRIYTDWKAFYMNDEIADIPIVDLTYLYVDKWVHDVIRKHNMTKTKYYNMAVILRQCLDYACEEELGIINSNPMNRVKITSKLFVKKIKPERETQVFQDNEQEILSKEACFRYEKRPDCSTPLAILLNFQIGLRIGELVALKWADINGNYLHIQRMEIETYLVDGSKDNGVTSCGYKIVNYTKSDAGDREVYLNNEAKRLLREVRKCNMKYGRFDDDFIFLTSDKGKRSNARTITKYLEKLCISTKILIKSNHKIRKTYISSLFDNGVNIDTIRRQAGHEDERTSLKNYCFDQHTDKEIESQLENASNKKTSLKVNQSVC